MVKEEAERTEEVGGEIPGGKENLKLLNRGRSRLG